MGELESVSNGTEQDGKSQAREWVVEAITEAQCSLKIDTETLIDKIIVGLPSTSSFDQVLTLAAETAASLTTQHPDYSTLAARILVQLLYNEVPDNFVDAMKNLCDQQILSESAWWFISRFKDQLLSAIDESQDNHWSYFGIQTLKRSYLLRTDQNCIAERPQYLLMRVAVGIHGVGVDRESSELDTYLDRCIETYKLMSERYFIHATPTLYYAATIDAQMASCFVVAMKDDSVEGIFDTIKHCAQISKRAGGIGLHISNIRSANSRIKKSGGVSGGILPMLRVVNNTARFVDQGGSRRPGAISVTLEPWHADIMAFLDLKKNSGKEEYRARDLFYALWIPDLFMEYVQANKTWYLFSPSTAPGLQDVWGPDFEKLYLQYVSEGRHCGTIPAQRLWNAILDAQIETGNPSILYKDACNRKSNQRNLGTIKSSNLCTEIIEYSSPSETAVCTLASIALPKFVKEEGGKWTVDYENLHRVCKVVTRNLNNIIDNNVFPVPEAERSCTLHRPISIGVQGLADLFFKLGLPYDSEEASQINERIFATIYHGALEASVQLVQEGCKPYSSFFDSPTSKGLLQFDLWDSDFQPPATPSWDWKRLKENIVKYGLRNSLVTGTMPTASTSQLLDFSESTEALTSNIYSRRTLSGDFQVINRYLVQELEKLDMWNNEIREHIMASNGSIQAIEGIPSEIKLIFRTVWELSQKSVIDLSASRARYIDQSQSMNIFIAAPTRKQLTSMHFYGWKKGLKTGLYYLRTMPAATPIPFTLRHDIVVKSRATTPQYPSSGNKRLRSDECDVCTS